MSRQSWVTGGVLAAIALFLTSWPRFEHGGRAVVASSTHVVWLQEKQPATKKKGAGKIGICTLERSTNRRTNGVR